MVLIDRFLEDLPIDLRNCVCDNKNIDLFLGLCQLL